MHAAVFLRRGLDRVAGGAADAVRSSSGSCAYAVGSEVVQHTLLPDRSGDWTDVVADLVGAAVGLLLARARRSRARGR